VSFYRSKEQASPFGMAQTISQVAALIGVPVAEVVAEAQRRSMPNAAPSTVVGFSTAEILLRVFQDN
jgi:hypothetical protein